jgi:murein DD-endopeptidase MepM/ murein hydrolase activator NlpD
MNTWAEFLTTIAPTPIAILDTAIPLNRYALLDLSTTNRDLDRIDITDPKVCQRYIDLVKAKSKADIAYGGYLERRNLYADKSGFTKEGHSPRNIHLGIDFWAKAGTSVIVPLEGKVHSFRNNDTKGDYGPTIILSHERDGFLLHTLYGHLSLESLNGLYVDQVFKAGSVLATLGTPDINVHYAPHLHFQIIMEMEGKKGDYPGVCSPETLDFYSKNCPDPNVLLKM